MSFFDPFAQLEKLLGQAATSAQEIFPPNSRYHATPVATFAAPDGTSIVYLRRRFVPRPECLATMAEHRVSQSERIDNITARYLGDPELYWRLCDANRAMEPTELEVVGRRVRIPLPDGASSLPQVG